MKQVKFLVKIEAHDMLNEDELTAILEYYLINKESIADMQQQVVGGNYAPDNFNLGSVSLERYKEKPAAKPKAKPKSKK